MGLEDGVAMEVLVPVGFSLRQEGSRLVGLAARLAAVQHASYLLYKPQGRGTKSWQRVVPRGSTASLMKC